MKNLAAITEITDTLVKRKSSVLQRRKLVREVKALNEQIRIYAFVNDCDFSTANRAVLSQLQK